MKKFVIILFVQITLTLPSFSVDISPFQRMSLNENTTFLAQLWNENFWQAAGADLNDPALIDLKNFTDENIIFMVAHWKTTSLDVTQGMMVIRNTSCKYNNANLEFNPLPRDLSIVMDELKDAFGSMAGQMGQNIEFVSFKKPLNYGKKGLLKLSYLNQHNLEWNIPLVEFLPSMLDPITREAFQGDYKFNPYNGRRLVPSF